MDLSELIAKFEQLGGRVGLGPTHATGPASDIADLTQRWLAAHPFLGRDQGYIDFLLRYSGAEWDPIGAGFGIAIAGFSGLGGYLDEWGPGDHQPDRLALTEDGLYPFATVCGYTGAIQSFETFVAIGFSFDGSGTRPCGIYRGITPQIGRPTPEQWYCGSFLEWLAIGIESRGHFPAITIEAKR